MAGLVPAIHALGYQHPILPLSAIGSAMVHFFLQSLVLLIAIVAVGHHVDWTYMPLVPLAIVALLFFTASLAIALSSFNVYFRDTGHMLELGLLAWMWLTPIIYQYELVATRLGSHEWIGRLNPITNIVLVFQRAIYGTTNNAAAGCSTSLQNAGITNCTKILPDESVWWYASGVLVVLGVSLVLVVVAFRIFGRLEGDFAEEI